MTTITHEQDTKKVLGAVHKRRQIWQEPVRQQSGGRDSGDSQALDQCEDHRTEAPSAY